MYIVYMVFLLQDDALLLNVLVNHMKLKRGKNHSVKDLSNISLFLSAFSSNFCFLFSASASFPSAFSANSDLSWSMKGSAIHLASAASTVCSAMRKVTPSGRAFCMTSKRTGASIDLRLAP